MSQVESLTVPQEVPAIQVQLARVALVTDPEYSWLPEEASRYLNVHDGHPTGPKIGEIELSYFYNEQYARPHTSLDIQRAGIGTEIYTAVPFIPLPGGEDFHEAGFKFRTTGQSEPANRLWESLVRKGLAQKLPEYRSYEMLDTIPPPERLEITETGMLPTLIVVDL